MRRSRLRLETLDERAVPDGNPGDPPGSPPPQAGDPSASNSATLAVGAWLYIGSVGDTDVYYSRTVDAGFVAAVNTVTGDFSITFAEYTTPIDLSTANGVQANFTPDASLPSAVWNPSTGTYSTVPAGTTFGTVSGYAADGWNFVVLPLAAGFDPAAERLIPAGTGNVSLSADPATPPGSIKVKIIGPNGQQLGPTVIVGPGGTITAPPGSTIQIDADGNMTIILPGQQPPPQRTPAPRPEPAPMPRLGSPLPPGSGASGRLKALNDFYRQLIPQQATDAAELESIEIPAPPTR